MHIGINESTVSFPEQTSRFNSSKFTSKCVHLRTVPVPVEEDAGLEDGDADFECKDYR